FPPRPDSARFVSDFLGLGRDLPGELSEFSGDSALMRSVSACRGLKLTRQEPFECLLSFMVSQNNNITRIRSTLLRLSEKLGEKVRAGGRVLHVFPTPPRLALASLHDLRSCGPGYRAEYVRGMARAVSNGFDLAAVASMDYDSAKRRLMELEGVGGKVADCVLVFGYGFGEAFPVDLWMARILKRHYVRRTLSASKLSAYARRRFGKKAAVAHEFLFAHREGLCTPDSKSARGR
ncbi:MAG: hypothetical protein V1787_01695, partial [Candidatus Micrarchaeota archaeon]